MKIANSSLSSNHPPELDSSTIKIKNLLQGYQTRLNAVSSGKDMHERHHRRAFVFVVMS